MSDDRVISRALGSLKSYAYFAFPDLTHAFSGVAAPALAVSVFGKDRTLDLGEIIFVKPDRGGTDDVVAVIEHEAVLVRVAEEIECLDRAAWAVVDFLNELAGAIEPDQRDVSLFGQVGNPSGVRLAIFT